MSDWTYGTVVKGRGVFLVMVVRKATRAEQPFNGRGFIGLNIGYVKPSYRSALRDNSLNQLVYHDSRDFRIIDD